MAETTIDLDQPIQAHDGLVKQITLREPRYRDVMQFGEPVARGYSTDGTIVYTAENIDIIRAYAARLIKNPEDKGEPKVDEQLLGQLGIFDTLRIKDAVLDFFRDARSKIQKSASTS